MSGKVGMLDYYRILGLSPGASEREIHRAFRRLSKMYHPDALCRAGASEEDILRGEERYKEITEAYAVLSDRVKRRRYDSLYPRAVHIKDRRKMNIELDFDIEEVYNSLFGVEEGKAQVPMDRGEGGADFSDLARLDPTLRISRNSVKRYAPTYKAKPGGKEGGMDVNGEGGTRSGSEQGEVKPNFSPYPTYRRQNTPAHGHIEAEEVSKTDLVGPSSLASNVESHMTPKNEFGLMGQGGNDYADAGLTRMHHGMLSRHLALTFAVVTVVGLIVLLALVLAAWVWGGSLAPYWLSVGTLVFILMFVMLWSAYMAYMRYHS